MMWHRPDNTIAMCLLIGTMLMAVSTADDVRINLLIAIISLANEDMLRTWEIPTAAGQFPSSADANCIEITACVNCVSCASTAFIRPTITMCSKANRLV